MSIEEQLKIVEKNIIGLWRFNIKGRKPKWCATYRIEGHYYDVEGCDTMGQALDRVIRQLKKSKK